MREYKVQDLTGMTFGRWKVLYKANKRDSNHIYWHCVCSCKNHTEKDVRADELKNGNSSSCGCIHSEVMKNLDYSKFRDKLITHGKTGTRLYTIWCKVKQRCYNKSHTAYKNYGGRGISMCDEWLQENTGFMNFYNWAVSSGYSYNLTLDRIDNNKNYCPSNCRWATAKEQANNKRTNHYIFVDGIKYTVSELAEMCDIKYDNFHKLLKRRNFDINKLFKDRQELYMNYESNKKIRA